MKKQPLISIAIPTFNRGCLLYSNLSELLEFSGNDFEVVVVDDASPDNTATILRSIEDSRFVFSRNKNNLNFVLNFKEVLKHTKGLWVLTLSDEDLVTPEIVQGLIDLVQNPEYKDLGVMLGNIRNDQGPYPYYAYHNGSDYVPYQYENRRFTRGDQAVNALGFHHKYLSGILVRRDCIDWQALDSYSREECGIAPQVDVYTRACATADAATFNRDFCLKRVARGEKSFIDRASSASYKHPKNRMVQFKYYITLADELISDVNLKIACMTKIYGYFIDEATYGWHKILKSKAEREYLFEVLDDREYDLASGVKGFHSEALSFIGGLLSSTANDAAHLEGLRNRISEKLSYFLNKRKIDL